MAKPRVFVSSTYYDLRHIRNSLETFIESMGYEAVLFESGDIPFRHDIPLDESCYSEINSCHMLVLIIGGRFGSPTSESGEPITNGTDEQYKYYNSITQKEYEKARDRDIPIFIFVDKSVLAEYNTYKKNRDNTTVKYVHVDSIKVFRLLDEILLQKRNNYIKEFEKFDDIRSWLRDQWAGLFADFLGRTRNEAILKDMASQISELRDVASVLQEYTKSIMKTIQPKESKDIIAREEKRLTDIKLQRFSREPLIAHLISNYDLLPSNIYSAVEKSRKLEDVLQSLELNPEQIKEFLTRSGPPARKELFELRLRYFGFLEDPILTK